MQPLRAMLALLTGLFAFAVARADDAASVSTPVQSASAAAVQAPVVGAHPAIWTVHGKHGTVYLLGSIHLLPPSMHWRTPEIADAIAKADVFAFEIPTDSSAIDAMRDIIRERGSLPPGKSLRALLSPGGQANLDKALVSIGVTLTLIDDKRPWLAALTLTAVRMMKNTGASPAAGLDSVLAKEAAAQHKELRYLETAQQQLDMLAPKDDDKLEVEEFESGLKKFLTETTEADKLLGAWASGDPAKIDTLFNDELKNYPKARRALLDDRNRAWIKKIEPMLDSEDKVFLITVGAGHLVGHNGVPNLLRRAGYKVDGP